LTRLLSRASMFVGGRCQWQSTPVGWQPIRRPVSSFVWWKLKDGVGYGQGKRRRRASETAPPEAFLFVLFFLDFPSAFGPAPRGNQQRPHFRRDSGCLEAGAGDLAGPPTRRRRPCSTRRSPSPRLTGWPRRRSCYRASWPPGSYPGTYEFTRALINLCQPAGWERGCQQEDIDR
jgi:hypothetical protein